MGTQAGEVVNAVGRRYASIAMADFITAAITFVLSNFPLTFLVIGLIVSLIAIARTEAPVDAATIVEKLISWHVFFAVGVSNLYNFVCHVFFGKMARLSSAGRQPLPVRGRHGEPGLCAVAFVAAFRSFDLRLAAILGPSLFLLGAAAGHIYQMVTEHNFAPGNAGIIFYTDIIIPLVGFVLLALQHRYGRPSASLI